MNKIQTYLTLIICCAIHAFASAQDYSPQIQQLLTQRRDRAAQHQDYASVERSIAGLGQLPPALVTKSVTAGKTQFDFNTYKDIRPEREDAIEQRLLVSVPGAETVSIENRHITVVFRETATEADVTEFLRLMGYASYELKTN